MTSFLIPLEKLIILVPVYNDKEIVGVHRWHIISKMVQLIKWWFPKVYNGAATFLSFLFLFFIIHIPKTKQSKTYLVSAYYSVVYKNQKHLILTFDYLDVAN